MKISKSLICLWCHDHHAGILFTVFTKFIDQLTLVEEGGAILGELHSMNSVTMLTHFLVLGMFPSTGLIKCDFNL